MKAVILNFTGARENWGCQSTSQWLHTFLCSVLPEGSTISTVPLPPTHILDPVVRKIYGRRIRSVFGTVDPKIEDLKFLERLVRIRFREFAGEVEKADIVFFQGEGTMGSSKLYESPLVFLLPFVAGRLWKKPVISLNQSFVVENHSDASVALNIFGFFAANIFREYESFAKAIDVGLNSSLICPDAAFLEALLFEKVQLPHVKEYFCVTGSAGLGAYDADAFADAIVSITQITKLKPIFLYSRKSDAVIADKIIQLGCALKTVSAATHPNAVDILPYLKGATFTIGGRYHTAIASLSMRTPVILTPGNSHKMKGLGRLLNLELPVYESENFPEISGAALAMKLENATWRARVSEGIDGVLGWQREFQEFLRKAIPLWCKGEVRICVAHDLLSSGFKNQSVTSTVVKRPELNFVEVRSGEKEPNYWGQLFLSRNLRRYSWPSGSKP